MSSRLKKYQETERMMKQLQEELLAMESDTELKQEMEFKEKLEALMAEFGVADKTVLQIIAPEKYLQSQGQTSTKPRKVRKLKVYKNPHTGEVIETRGGNHKGLKALKDEHGAEVVEGWLINDDADNKKTEA
ncbi:MULTISPECIES: histone-like nucleoid-structuring protein, MvaT/MvaU family [Halomonas]|jgi:hypothetical protein|uniref:histone-like nucleoid-structuring protein, MvaT/MvaU family n=1 Tax=Halomonas TaxID=2745 RepID=UPI00155226D8|nr:histone-like nucleoid-structuring protein, MvaT/MvaU family [Halomonas hibernica]